MKMIYGKDYQITDKKGTVYKSRAAASKAHRSGEKIVVWYIGSNGKWIEGGEI